jgi:hypothetical protein
VGLKALAERALEENLLLAFFVAGFDEIVHIETL